MNLYKPRVCKPRFGRTRTKLKSAPSSLKASRRRRPVIIVSMVQVIVVRDQVNMVGERCAGFGHTSVGVIRSVGKAASSAW